MEEGIFGLYTTLAETTNRSISKIKETVGVIMRLTGKTEQEALLFLSSIVLTNIHPTTDELVPLASVEVSIEVHNISGPRMSYVEPLIAKTNAIYLPKWGKKKKYKRGK